MEIELVPTFASPSYWYVLRNDIYRLGNMFARVYTQYKVECIVFGTEFVVSCWLFTGGFTYLLNLRTC